MTPAAASTPDESILLFGATGQIGTHITRALVDAAPRPFSRLAIFTSEQTAKGKKELVTALEARGVEVLVGDVGDEGVVRGVVEGFTTVVSALGRGALSFQENLIAAVAASPTVTRFFPSEYGTDVAFDATSADEKTHQAKLGVRRLVEGSEAVKVGRLAYTYLVTGPYPEMFVSAPPGGEARVGGFDVQAKRAWVLGDGEGRVAFTSMPDVGKFLVAALRHPDAVRNRAVRVHSFTASPKDIVAAFERQTGGGKWGVKYVSLEELERFEKEAWETGNPFAAVATLRRIWASGKTLYEEWDEGLLGGVEVEGLEGVVGRMLKGV